MSQRDESSARPAGASSPRAQRKTREGAAVGPPHPERGTFARGELIHGRFRILRYLARGGAGEVYEAFDTEIRCPVALKVVRPEVAENDQAVERFRREIALARQVTHPNVCRIFDVFRHPLPRRAGKGEAEALFLTMELLVGESLAYRIKQRGPMSPAQALPIVEDMAAGLSAAHRAGVVHRDFKSANVMLAREGDLERAVITDFGLAQAEDPDDPAPLTQTGTVVGTPNYMAPEQLTGDVITPAVDQYALGIVIYEMMTGIRPFRGETDLSTAVKRLTELPASPRSHVPDIDSRWERAVLRCLERKPEDRFPSLERLVEVLRGEIPIAPPKSRSKRPRAGFLLASSAALLLVLAAGFRLSTSIGSNLTTSRPTSMISAVPAIAVFDLANLNGDSESQWLASALPEMITMELAQAGGLQPVSDPEVDRIAASLGITGANTFSRETLMEIRRQLGADLILEGSYLASADSDVVRLHLRLHSDGPQQRLLTIGSKAELAELVNRASAELRSHLGVSSSSSTPGEPASEAQRLRRIGREEARQLKIHSAVQLFEQALAKEPENGLTHALFARALATAGDTEAAKREAGRAEELGRSLPRDAFLEVQAHVAMVEHDYVEAAELFSSLHRFYPADPDHLADWLEALVAGGQAERALEALSELDTERRESSLEDLRLRLLLAHAHGATGSHRRQLEVAVEAVRQAENRGAGIAAGEGELEAAAALFALGRLDEAAERARTAERLFGRGELLRGELESLDLQIAIEERRGRAGPAAELRRRARERTRAGDG